ncbi:MAG TPA: cytochrome c biogenesis protein ResB [Candidatus Paceibacterota bacterium]|nr:cytochrome c biogenesis protein ResB [Verrucomicrobiota bacterium]HRY48704.1 cytochrome c biogenesis protein ResB [Candidatus Paceibacterota bacterium]
MIRWLGSLKLAVVVLSVLSVVLIAATIYESKTTTAEVQRLVYQSWWFITLLGLLGLNVFCAALARYPWKKHQAGFVLTHAGIIVLLVGSIVGLLFGVEGSVTLVEGGPPQRFFRQDYEVLNITEVGGQEFVSAPLKGRANGSPPATGYRLSTAPLLLEVTVRAHHLHTQEELVVKDGGQEFNPALRFVFTARMGDTNHPEMSIQEWLIAGDPQRRSLNLGPAAVRLEKVSSLETLRQRLEPPSEAAQSGKGLLELTINRQNLAVPVEENIGREFKTASGDAAVKIRDYYADFRMDEQNRRPMTVSDQPNNPAVLFEATTAQGRTIGFVFANFPDMSLFRHEEGTNQIDAVYRFERANQGQMNLLTLLAGPSNQVHYTLTSSRADRRTGEVQLGQPIPLAWMANAAFTVQEYFPQPQISTRHVPAPQPGSEMAATSPALELELQQGDGPKAVTARWGEPLRVDLGGKTYELLYGFAMRPLGFSIELKKFAAPSYEGTTMPASYESYVKVQDPETGDALEKKIWMNHPLTYGGYRISQASYNESADGTRMLSVLQVMRDPGYPLKGIGSILLTLGTILIFCVRRPNPAGSEETIVYPAPKNTILESSGVRIGRPSARGPVE